MLKIVRSALLLLALLSLLTGLAYPLLVTGIAAQVFPHQANGSLVTRNDNVVGSELIGQSFTAQGYFWGRPSATAPMAYNGAAGAGTNAGPTNPALRQSVVDRLAAIKKSHPDQAGVVPIDMVTSSASGLDPHITPAAALYQAARVAHARGLPEQSVRDLISQHTQTRTFGVLGERRVNVLLLNLALDGQAK
ncbi:MAG: potassium-transporting ATPase subunit KdpC [Pirellulales bacterium]|nr:potassium-transporting ATPase subunit KdpC [Pirellulales bacterium]